MGYEELSMQGFINEIKDVSYGPHPRKFCFVLGAGASRTSGIKSGQELVDIWDKELSLRNSEAHEAWKKSKGINSDNRHEFYSHYYDRRFSKEPQDGYNYLEKIMGNAKPSAGYVMLAHLLCKTNHNVVITTNFDHLIEDAVNYYSQTIPLVIGHEALAHYITNQITRPTIVKIHRDLLLDPKSRSSEVEVLHKNWHMVLDKVLSEYHPVFIGYAGNDNSLMDFLIDNSHNFIERKWKYPYWMLYKDGKLEGKIESFLDKSNGYYIRHDGFDETLFLIGSAFEYTIPEEDQFLSDAKKRYQSLSNSLAEFSEQYSRSTSASESSTVSDEADKNTDILHAILQVTDKSELLRMHREAVLLHNTGQYEDALKIKRELIKNSPENALYHSSLGITLHEMGMYKDALAEKYKAIELEPTSAKYHDSLGVTLHVMGNYEEAMVAMQKAIELEPTSAKYHNSLGVTLHEMGRYEEATVEKEEAIELEPTSAKYHNRMGVTLHEMGNYEEAMAATQKAIELEPTSAEYHESLSVTLHEMGRYEESLTATQKAIELEPTSAEYHKSLSITLHKMGRHEEALVAEEKARELGNNKIT